MSITYTQLLKNFKKDVWMVNYNNVLLSKKSIEGLCVLTKSKVVCWDYVNMKATLKKI